MKQKILFSYQSEYFLNGKNIKRFSIYYDLKDSKTWPYKIEFYYEYDYFKRETIIKDISLDTYLKIKGIVVDLYPLAGVFNGFKRDMDEDLDDASTDAFTFGFNDEFRTICEFGFNDYVFSKNKEALNNDDYDAIELGNGYKEIIDILTNDGYDMTKFMIEGM